MQMKMFDVNFGESVLYQEGKDKVLVDCGAKYGGKGCLAYGVVRHAIDKNTKLIITHFDEDHYNGILNVPCGIKFKKIILPLYLYQKSQSNTMDFFIDTIRTWTYMAVSGEKQKLRTLHKLFLKLPHLVNSVFDIRCAGLGDCISIGNKKIKVLWPESNSSVGMPLYSDVLREIVRESVEDDRLFDTLMENAEHYVASFLKIYQFYCSNQREQVSSEMNAERLMEELEELDLWYQKIDAQGVYINRNSLARKKIQSIYSIKIRNMNECSIVFEIGNEVLAFGDVSSRIIRYLKKNQRLSHNLYEKIKVQHHGTKSYWSDDIPYAKKYYVSNSGTWNKKWSICENYGKYFNGNMFCVNNNGDRCKYYKSGNRCVNCRL